MTKNFFNEGQVLEKLHKMENDVNKELNQENIDYNKVTKLRMEQLLKGMQLTQNPLYDM